MDIAERVALVTGAGVGTGQAISIRLAALGAAVVLTDVSEAGTTLRRIQDAGGRGSSSPPILRGPRLFVRRSTSP